MKVLIECTKGTKEKYELAKDGKSFDLIRMLEHKWAASYGFIPHTLQADGDQLDAYVLGKVKQGEEIEAMPLCLVYTFDNGEIDNKLITVAMNDSGLFLRYRAKRICRFINKYKKGCTAVAITWKSENIRYEIAKRKAMYNLFIGGTNE